MGNPPYSGESKNNGAWIVDQINSYKFIDGKPLGESNTRWLQNDYVKFIRFAQYKMDQIDDGIVGVITAHSFLDNPTFRGMRRSLMGTYSQIYIVDLHGSLEKREKAPDGSKDENVFDIETGVSISIFVRRVSHSSRHIYHCDFWGRRSAKYRQCLELSLDSIEWTELTPEPPHYLFRPHDTTGKEEYEFGWKVTDILPVYSNGIVTARDHLCVQFSSDDMNRVVADLARLPAEVARQKYRLRKDVRDWKVELAQADLTATGLDKDRIVPLNYRPFDTRYTYYTPNSRGFLCMPRDEVMRHMFRRKNVALITSRMTKGEVFHHVLATSYVSEAICLSPNTSNNGFVFPLYLYRFEGEERHMVDLFGEGNTFTGTDRRENLSPAFRTFVDQKYGRHYKPEQIFGYVYATLNSKTYRSRNVSFLALDFPRIPFADSAKVFERLAEVGWELAQAHCFAATSLGTKVHFPQKGDNVVTRPRYESARQALFINDDQYFQPVQQKVWDFQIGGYRVLEKFLKSRRNRVLSLEENENLAAAIRTLEFSVGAMDRIDAVWREAFPGAGSTS